MIFITLHRATRSHSWNGLLTLCVVFNAIRNPKEKMQEFLDKWVEMITKASKDEAVVEVLNVETSVAAFDLGIIGTE